MANLLLARSLARAREFAVRVALGASRLQLARQLMTESVLLSLTGGALGLVLARWDLLAVLAAAPGSLPRVRNIAVNASVLCFALGVSILVGILFGLLPAWKSSKTDPQIGLKGGGRGSTLGHQRTQHGLVIAQIALAVVLLAGGSLLFRTIRNLWAANPGFNTQDVLTFQVGLSPAPIQTPAEIRNGYRRLMERMRQIPGVQAADITALVPFSQLGNAGPFWIGPHQPASMAEIPRAEYYWIGPDYFNTMQIPLLRGRSLSPDDTTSSEPVIVIDTVLARGYFGNRDPVGQTVTIPHWTVARVVGVVGHVRQLRLGGSNSVDEEPQIYASIYELLDPWLPAFSKDVRIVVRTPLKTAVLIPAIKGAISGAVGGAGDPFTFLAVPFVLIAATIAACYIPARRVARLDPTIALRHE